MDKIMSKEMKSPNKKLESKLKERLHAVPMPTKYWEQRMFALIIDKTQERAPGLALLWSNIVATFARNPILGPAFSMLLLLAVYWAQPFSYWTPAAISEENALSYVEDMTAVSHYEPAMEIIANGWIIDY